jgi:hypothetical protein
MPKQAWRDPDRSPIPPLSKALYPRHQSQLLEFAARLRSHGAVFSEVIRSVVLGDGST